MLERHELAQLALDCALHGLPEPEDPWRSCIPTQPILSGRDNLGYLGMGRSHNIETLAISAWVCFVAHGIAPKKDRGLAVAMARDLLTLNRSAFLANEFGSTIYSGWTISGWAALAWGLDLLGEAKLALGYRELLTEWLALARASLAQCPADGLHLVVPYQAKGGKTEVLDESMHAGRWIVTICGERSWGHGHGLAYGHHMIARIAFGIEAPKPARQLPPPGNLDRWMGRLAGKLSGLLRACAHPAIAAYDRKDWPALVGLLKYPAAQPCELRVYNDGSRIFVEGGDEAEAVDEDNNSNTMRIALLAVYRTPPRILSLPPWPAPNGGDTRIRQKPVWSDIDRDIDGNGWSLVHSEVGDLFLPGVDKWVSKAPDPTAVLVARITCFGKEGWVLTGPRESEAQAPTPPPYRPPTPAKPVAGSRRGWLCARMRRLLGRPG